MYSELFLITDSMVVENGFTFKDIYIYNSANLVNLAGDSHQLEKLESKWQHQLEDPRMETVVSEKPQKGLKEQSYHSIVDNS